MTTAAEGEVANVPVEAAEVGHDLEKTGESSTISDGSLEWVRHLRELVVVVGEMPYPRDLSRVVWERWDSTGPVCESANATACR